jgi:hypothetical protein
MQRDERGFRVALVANELVNSPPERLDALAVLERAGWGAIVLPPSWYPDDVAAELLDHVAEQVEEFARHGYELVCVGLCPALEDALARVGLDMPDILAPAGAAELVSLLADRRVTQPGY